MSFNNINNDTMQSTSLHDSIVSTRYIQHHDSIVSTRNIQHFSIQMTIHYITLHKIVFRVPKITKDR